MAVIKFVKVKKGNLKNAVSYITRQDKTDENLIYCKDCRLDSIIQEFNYTKKLYNNLEGRQYYHFIQSFSPKDKLDYELANNIGKEMCSYFKDYQVIMTTHKDKDYIHNHFIINSVNMNTGKKYHQSKKELEDIKRLSNEICKRYNLKTINMDNKEVSKYLGSKEFHLSKKEITEKTKLITNINECIKYSLSKEQFIFLMKEQGYKVLWKDTRKYITYTTPNNYKFRDIRLKNIKYTKEKMERYFERINKNNKIKNVLIKLSSCDRDKNVNKANKSDMKEYSDIAKKDYIKKKENSSSIEWESDI